MFVEDVVSSVALKLDVHPNISGYSVEAETMESIHNHSAYAYIERPPRLALQGHEVVANEYFQG